MLAALDKFVVMLVRLLSKPPKGIDVPPPAVLLFSAFEMLFSKLPKLLPKLNKLEPDPVEELDVGEVFPPVALPVDAVGAGP